MNATTKDRTSSWNILLCCGIFIWFVVNLLQGIFTEIQADEAYYSLYGEHLAWGYFDHPPMVGLMTWLGSRFFSGNLGVRLLTVLSASLLMLVLWKLLDETRPTPKKVWLFFILAGSITMLHFYGFITTPDVPMLLFSSLFLWAYRDYLKAPSWAGALWMGLLMACMVYSKYHALLLLFLIVLSNLSLLKDRRFYAACLLALVLLTPHLLWQYHAGFPSLRYHLVQRSEPFRWSYVLEYLPNQLLVFNPFTFAAMVAVLVRRRALDRFERGLRFIAVGFFLFFFGMAFRGHVEPHWTVVGAIPVVVVLYRWSLVDTPLRRYVKWVILPSLVLLVALRIVLLTPLAAPYGVSGKEPYYRAIESVAGDTPVAFQGSFQRPALYHFFTGKPSSTLQSYYDRQTQFDLWQFDLDWPGRKVFVQSEFSPLNQSFPTEYGALTGFFADPFQSANRLVTDLQFASTDHGAASGHDANPAGSTPPVYHAGDTLHLAYSIYNPYPQPVDFHRKPLEMDLVLLLLDTDTHFYAFHDPIDTIPSGAMHTGWLKAVIPDAVPPGRNHLTLGMGDRMAIFSTVDHAVELLIESPKPDRSSSY